MKKVLVFLAALFILGQANAQTNNPQIRYVTAAPSGACGPTQIDEYIPSGVLYTCQSGTWGPTGGGAGSGTVTSVSGPSIFTWANPTTTPTATLNSQSANLFLGSPNGSSGTPAFRALVNADLPSGIATLGANTFTGTQTAPAFAGSGSNPFINLPSNTSHTYTSGDFVNNAGCLEFNNGSATQFLPVTLTTTGTSGAATISSGCVLNIPQYSGGSSGTGGGSSGWSGLPLTFLSNTTQYAPPVGGALTSTTESVVQLASSITGSLSGLQVSLSAALGTGTTLAVTLRVGGVSQALTCTTASSGTTCSDTTDVVSVTQGQLLDFLLVSSGTVTAGLPQVEIGYSVLATSSGFGYTLISKQVLGSPAASVTFSSIPGTYNNLRLVINGACSAAAVVNALTFQFNSDTAAHYATQLLRGTNGVVSATAFSNLGSFATSAEAGAADCASAASGSAGITNVEIPNYTGTTFVKKFFVADGADATTTFMLYDSWTGIWNSTSAITGIVVSVNGGSNFVTGSTFYLYGY